MRRCCAVLIGPALAIIAGCSGDGGAAPTTTAFDPTALACVSAAGSATVGDVTIEVLPPATCDTTHQGIIRVTNGGDLSCSSNMTATVSGRRIVFVSVSGFGGEVGHWESVDDSAPDEIGVIEYPPGTREWPLAIPAGLVGPLDWSIPAIDCGADQAPAVVTFEAVAAG